MKMHLLSTWGSFSGMYRCLRGVQTQSSFTCIVASNRVTQTAKLQLDSVMETGAITDLGDEHINRSVSACIDVAHA